MNKKIQYSISFLVVTFFSTLVFAQSLPFAGEGIASKHCPGLAKGPKAEVDPKSIGKWKLVRFFDEGSKSEKTVFESVSAPEKIEYGTKFTDGKGPNSDFPQEEKKYCCGHLKMSKSGKFICGENGMPNPYSEFFGGLTGKNGRGHIAK